VRDVGIRVGKVKEGGREGGREGGVCGRESHCILGDGWVSVCMFLFLFVLALKAEGEGRREGCSHFKLFLFLLAGR